MNVLEWFAVAVLVALNPATWLVVAVLHSLLKDRA